MEKSSDDSSSPSVSTPPQPVSTPPLPDGFEIDTYLRQADTESNIVRVVARVLGEQRDVLLIDTPEGIYELPSRAVRRLQFMDDSSLFILDIDLAATCMLHTTVRRLIRTRTGTFPSGSADELLAPPQWSEARA